MRGMIPVKLCDNYDDVLRLSECENIRVADMSIGKAYDDGYRGPGTDYDATKSLMGL